jgi:hypothetical protein
MAIRNNVHIALSKEIRRKGDITTLLGYTRSKSAWLFSCSMCRTNARAGLGTEQLPLP